MNDVNWQKLFSTYSFFVEHYEGDNKFVARCMEFPSLRISGDSKEDSIKNLQKDLVDSLIQYKSSKGDFPTPVVDPNYKEGPFVREVIRQGQSVVEEVKA